MNLFRSYRFFIALLTLVLPGIAAAQSPQATLGDDARSALQQGQIAAARAISAYDLHYPDLPLWQEAIERGEEARDLAPGSLAPVRFLAQVYTTTQWHFRAWEAWEAYLEAGGELDVQARRDAVESAVWLGYDRYQAGNLQGAVGFFEAAHELAPENPQATGWLGRAYFEMGRPEQAVPLLQMAVRQMPAMGLFGTYLDRAEHQLAYGLDASNAYFDGVRAADEGRYLDAVQSFRGAVRANPNFHEAMVAAAEAYMALERPEDAIPYWEGALSIEPGDDQAEFFLELARDQVTWGVGAVQAFRQGRSQLQAGNPQAAANALATAVQQNPAYAQAWALRAQAEEALGDDDDAETFYARAADLEPQNLGYASALADVRDRIELAQAPPVAEPEPPVATEPAPAAQAAPPPAAQEPEPPVQAEAPPPSEPEPAAQTPEPPPPTEPEPAAQAPQPPPPTEPVPAAQAPEPGTPSPQALEAQPPPAQPAPQSPPVAAAPVDETPETSTSSGVFVLLDTTLTHGLADDTSAFRFVGGRVELVPDLTTPVDYAGGTLLHRIEVMSKPTDRNVQYQLCLVPQNITSRPACTAESGLAFAEPGVYEHSQALPSLSQYGNVDWSEGLSSLMVIVKDEEGNPIDGGYPLREQFVGAPDLSIYYPMEVRYTVVLVPENGSFVGWRAVE